jgi:hypothetical protein
MTILPDLNAVLRAEVAAANARIAELEARLAKPAKALTFKVTDKGACSVYGLQRFPVTLYAGQWIRLIEAMPELHNFLEANKTKLSHKP